MAEKLTEVEESTWRFKNATVSCQGEVYVNGSAVNLSAIGYSGCGFMNGVCERQKLGPYARFQDKYMRPETPQASQPGGPVKRIVVLTQPTFGYYYHFLVESISRLYWIRKDFPEMVQDNATFFHTGWVLTGAQVWANLLGIQTTVKASRLLDGCWQAEEVIFPPSNGCFYGSIKADPMALRWMRHEVQFNLMQSLPKSHLGCDTLVPSAPGKNILLLLLADRRNKENSHRLILNEHAAMAVVERALPDFAVFVFSDFPRVPPVLKACTAFYCADLVAGPHGAGLSNLFCSRAGTPVIEFTKKPRSMEYEILTTKLELPYFQVSTTMKPDQDGEVNLFELKRALGKATRLRREPIRAVDPNDPETSTSTPYHAGVQNIAGDLSKNRIDVELVENTVPELSGSLAGTLSSLPWLVALTPFLLWAFRGTLSRFTWGCTQAGAPPVAP